MDINSQIMKFLKLLLFLTTITHIADGCQIDGINSWLVPVEVEVTDIFRGIFFQRSTTNIIGINTISFGEGLMQGPYVELSYSNNQFNIATNNNFPNYEENETAHSMAVTVVFNCAGGTTSALVLMIDITDTNNNAPQFKPNDQFEFTIAPPLSPNFAITGCESGIVVRDIDLTTQRINFEIEDNPYFQITYVPSSTPKEFTARLSTTTYIRTFPEPLTLRISATDVDLTNDPPLTTYGTIRIQGDNSFSLPDDMVFAETFYLGNYEQNNEVSLLEPITLKQGFDAEVNFSLVGDYSTYFNLIGDDNKLSLIVSQPLPNAVQKAERQIYLIVKAERELITPSSATIILNLPEDTDLLFEESSYQGTIENNILSLPQLILSQGYQDEIITIDIEYEYSSFFNASIQANVITLSINNINQDVINENNYIQLKVIASCDRSSAVTIVTLEVVKDDNITPVFAKSVYPGTYDTVRGLTLEQLEIIQGFDETVSVELLGDQSIYFSISQNGQFITLVASQIPTNILAENNLLFTVQASKPRTVGAAVAVSINLPEARELSFDAPFYKGSIQNSTLTLGTISLKNGYDVDVNFTLSGDYSNYFDIKDNQNEINVFLSDQITDNIIKDNNILILTLSAYGTHAIPTSTSIFLEIIKDDLFTPLFTKNIYYGNFIEGNKIEIENISLEQGYDDSIVFGIEGELASYFDILQNGNNIEIFLDGNIPEAVIFDEKVFVFSVLANKPLTIGGRASVHIRFPDDLINLELMTFESSTYLGNYKNNSLYLDSIILELGYKPGTQFKLSGEYASYFTFNYVNNIATISILNALPIQILENNFIVLEVEASRDRAVSVSTTIIIDIIKEYVVYPVFSESNYQGVYVDGQGLEIDQIYLAQGYDVTVFFELEGDNSEWFRLLENGNSISLITDGIPENVLGNNSHLIFSIVAHKTDVISVRSTIIIILPKEIPIPLILGFEQKSYVGKIESSELQLVDLILLEEYNITLQFDLTGELETYFTIIEKQNSISIQLLEPLPDVITNDINLITLDVSISNPGSISGHATVIIDLIKAPESVAPVFAEAFYVGEYTVKEGLVFSSIIQLSQGYDESVVFSLDGDDSGWFAIIENGQNNLTLSLTNDTLDFDGKMFLMFSMEARKLNTIIGKTAVLISLTASSLKFSEQYYVGALTGTNLLLDTIILEEGYSSDIQIELIGEFNEYFTINHQNGLFTLQLDSELPPEVIIEMNLLVFSLEVKVASSKSSAIVVIEIVSDKYELEFSEVYYSGIYSKPKGLSFEQQIILKSGFDGTVVIRLEGDDSQWFTLNQNEDSFSLIQNSSIPDGVLENYQQLIFSINAQKPYHSPADATIVISLEKKDTTHVLSFERINYVGSIENGVITLDPIRLSETNMENINITLFGELQNYFQVDFERNVVVIELVKPLPESVEDKNGIVVLEIQASATEAVPAYSTIIFEIINPEIVPLQFNEKYYTGYLESEELIFESTISIIAGYDESVKFELQGDNAQWFGLTISSNSASLELVTPIPSVVLESNYQLAFLITATNAVNLTTSAPIIISILKDNLERQVLTFDQISYSGFVNNTNINLDTIIVSEGYSSTISFSLFGVYSDNFEIITNGPQVTIAIKTDLELDSINLLILELQAKAPAFITAHATIVLEVVKDKSLEVITFNELYYVGQYSQENGVSMENLISLVEGYDDTVLFDLKGDSSIWFALQRVNDNSYTITLKSTIPPATIANNDHFIFTVTAQKPDSREARATIIISNIQEYNETSTLLGFEKKSYTGTINHNISTLEQIVLTEGYSENVKFILHGAMFNYFSVDWTDNTVSVILQTPISEDYLSENNIIVLELEAFSLNSLSVYATIIFEVSKEVQDLLVFEETYYNGEYSEDGGLQFDSKIALSKGYDDDVIFNLEGDSAKWFSIDQSGNSGSLLLDTIIPTEVIENNTQLIFIVNAVKTNTITARATIIITLDRKEEEKDFLAFEETSYLGTLEAGILISDSIIMSEGSSLNVSLQLEGELSSYFAVSRRGASITITLENTIPEEAIPSNKIIILQLHASAPEALPAFATIVLEVVSKKVYFDKILYSGIIQGSMVQHEIITISEYTGTVYVTGDYANLFSAILDNGEVSITINGSLVLPSNVTSIFLELIADDSRAVLLLNIENADTPVIPTITFSSETYDLEVNVDQTGFIGQVYAIADNGEAITYALKIENEHLLQRISINVDGKIHLSAPTMNGTYNFTVKATTIITKASETASIILTVSDYITCTNDDVNVPPLIVINRDEEEPHYNLITSDLPGCRYVMTNRWPTNQTWLYVDNDGLHTIAIDREHPSIAFMPLSQVQIELLLECEGDRHRRSINYKPTLGGLGPYDYGNSTWLLSDTIEFNQRKTVVNLIVNDINDNKPIFDGKELEPLVVGYPITELEDIILPRSLAELQASDADVGENALLMYWTAESVIAVSPTTGFVHVRQGAILDDNMRLIVHATDRFGEGWTSSIELVVKLVDSKHIVVVTVRDVFLDDEKTILENLSTSVGYEVKALRSTIGTEDLQSSDGQTISRIKRATSNDVGTSMMLFVYGLVDKEPVPVEQLQNDISSIASAAVSIVNTVSLEDHLEGREIYDISGRDTGLFVATIVLSVLLFILIMAIGLWFFLKWWKNRNYDEFSDERSIGSERKSIEELPKPESMNKPRLNIDDLRRSEKRLQEMLDAPIQNIEVKPTLPIREIEIPPISPHFIQSIDKLKKADDDSDEDEFGERKTPRRKSMVTFNENVEKIIHVEDDLNDDSDYEVYKL